MNSPAHSIEKPTRVRFGVLAFCCVLSMITYLDRVCFGTVAPFIQKEFALTDTQLGWLFSAFALAYAMFEIPTGWLGDLYGPRKTLIRIVVWWSLFTTLTGLIYPSMAGAFFMLLAVRFLFGLGEAGAYPNIARAFHNWFPFQERASVKGSVWMAGRFAGGITTFIVLLLVYQTVGADNTTVVRWRHIFWIFGGLGLIWCVGFWLWFRDRPEDKAGVNQAEIELIRGGEDHSREPLVVPWKAIFTNWNLWTLCIMYFCAAYGWYFNITYLPKFLGNFYGIQRGETWSPEFWRYSLMCGMPLLLGSLACLFGGYLSDLFIKKTGNRKWGRRLFGVVGHSLCAVCYFTAIYMNSAWGFVLAIAFAAFWNDMTMGASWASCLDIGRRYSGIVAGAMNTVGNLGGFVAGFLSGMILDYFKAPLGASAEQMMEATRTGWTVNFFTYAGVYILAVVMWFLFDSTKPVAPDQPKKPTTVPVPPEMADQVVTAKT